jgi:hypothetical protein
VVAVELQQKLICLCFQCLPVALDASARERQQNQSLGSAPSSRVQHLSNIRVWMCWSAESFALPLLPDIKRHKPDPSDHRRCTICGGDGPTRPTGCPGRLVTDEERGRQLG